MATTIRLTVVTGPHKQRRFCFRGPARCTIGRALDCSVRLAGAERDFTVSRHHCRLDINGCVRLQDLGSLNGTYRNGKKLEPDLAALTEATALLSRKLSVAEKIDDGDIVTIGDTSFRVNMVDCPLDLPKTDSSAEALADCPRPC